MNKHSRLWVQASGALLFAALLFCPVPPAVNAQTGEWVETGRFGANEGEEPPLPATPEETGLAGKWFYVGARLGPSLRIYTPSGDTMYTGAETFALALDTAIEANLRILPFLSLQGEMIFTWDSASSWRYTRRSGVIELYTQNYTAFLFQFPLLLRLDLYPGQFRLSPFLGAYFLAPLGDLTAAHSLDNKTSSWIYRISPPVGVLGGLSVGWKLGPGVIFGDLRYSLDLGEPEVLQGDLKTYRRSMVSLSVGYEFGFVDKRRGNSP